YSSEKDAVLAHAVERAMMTPVAVEPPVGIIILVISLGSHDHHFSMRRLGKAKVFSYMLPRTEIIHDHSDQGDQAEKTDHPQRTKGIAQVVRARADAGDP